MSVAMALDFSREWFIKKYGFKRNECGVQYQTYPSYDAGPFYVGLDDAGVEVGRDDTESLMEIISINVGIWRRKEHFMKDQIGELKLPYDIYQAGSKTLNWLERRVIVDRISKNMFGLHGNWQFMAGLNEHFNLPHETDGAPFVQPFRYRGRGSMVTKVQDQAIGGADVEWFGYILRFRGLMREQVLHTTTRVYG